MRKSTAILALAGSAIAVLALTGCSGDDTDVVISPSPMAPEATGFASPSATMAPTAGASPTSS